MSKRWIGLLITTFLSFGFFGAGIADATEEPAADEVWLFGSEHCADCTAFRQWWADHPGQVAGLKLVILPIDGVMNFKRFLALEKKWERKAGSTFPVIAFRRDFVFGEGIVDRFIDRLTSPSIVESQYLVVDSARIASINEQDPGNIYVYIRNTSSVPFQFKEIRLNEKPIPVWGVDLNIEAAMTFFNDNPGTPRNPGLPNGLAAAVMRLKSPDEPLDMYSLLRQVAAKQVLWAYFDPGCIPPGGIGEFVAKLRHPIHGALRLDFESVNGKVLSHRLSREAPALIWSAITFSPKLDRAYLYVESQIDRTQTLQCLEIDGADRTEDAEFTSRFLEPGGKQLAIVNLNPPLTSTAHLTAKVVSTEGVAEDRVRVAHFFPIHTESGIGNPRLAMDGEPFLARPFAVMGDEKTTYTDQSQGQADYLLECMNHRFGDDWERSAKMLLMRHFMSRARRPDRLTLSHICRNDPLSAFPRFSQLTDLIEVNPSYLAIPPEADAPAWRKSMDTFPLARKSHAPHPVVAVASTERFSIGSEAATPGEFRQRLYALLAMAPKGILYRLSKFSANHATSTGDIDQPATLTEEIVAFNKAIRPFREQLAIAHDFPGLISPMESDAPVAVHSLLAGDQGIFLIMIADSKTGTFPPAGSNIIRLAVSEPWSRKIADTGRCLDGNEKVIFDELQKKNGILEIAVSRMADAYWLPFSR